MAILYYISHPNVAVDPSLEVPKWRLNPEGRRRATVMLTQPWVEGIGRVVSSDEVKAVETAELLASHLRTSAEIRPGIGENDRSATGFVPPDQFEQLADAFFAEPTISVQGWERAIDAQSRIVAGLADLLPTPGGAAVASGSSAQIADQGGRDVAVIGHGGVGTLWYCHLAGLPIDRRHDQPAQGHVFAVDMVQGVPLSAWQPIDAPLLA